MAKGTLVGVNVSDTDELRINKINSNFRLLFDKANKTNQGSTIDETNVAWATAKDLSAATSSMEDELTIVKQDISAAKSDINDLKSRATNVIWSYAVAKNEDDEIIWQTTANNVTALEHNGLVVINIKNVQTYDVGRNLICWLKNGYFPRHEITSSCVMLGVEGYKEVAIVKVATDGTVLVNAYGNPKGMEVFANVSYFL